MTPEKIHESLHRQQVGPFRVFMSDGSAHDVRHPEMALLTRREVAIALPPKAGQFPNGMVICDLLHVTRLEPINGSDTPKSPKKRGK